MTDQSILAKLDRKYRSFLNHGFLVRVDRQEDVEGWLLEKSILPSGAYVFHIQAENTFSDLYLFGDENLYENISVEQRLTVSYCDCLIIEYTLHKIDGRRYASECFPKDSVKDCTAFWERRKSNSVIGHYFDYPDPDIISEIDKKYRSFLKHGFKVRIDRQQHINDGCVKNMFITPSGGKCLVIYDYNTDRYVYLLADEEGYDNIMNCDGIFGGDSIYILYCESLILFYRIVIYQGSNDLAYDFNKDLYQSGTCFMKTMPNYIHFG